MKKINTVLRFSAFLAMAAALTSCVSPRVSGGVGEYLDDSVITNVVKSRLAADELLKPFQIGVGTYQGSVQLSGFVDSKKAFDKAAELALSVKGVQSITNNLIVK
jgi:osmotically-inducible protein OsmY